MLSNKSIPAHERLIFALDVPTSAEARALVEELGDSVSFYKVGLELFMAGGYIELIDWLIKEKGKKVFADLKFFDVPQTVASAVRNLARTGAHFATVHGNDAIMQAAAKEKGAMRILAVTALTSLDRGDLDDLGFSVDVADLVLSRAKRSLQLGCDGVISSGLEAPAIRESVGDKILIITPGVRPVQNDDDQKRVVDVAQAFENGADYIVVGRPIRDHHGFSTRKEAAESIQKTIASVFSS